MGFRNSLARVSMEAFEIGAYDRLGVMARSRTDSKIVVWEALGENTPSNSKS